MIYPYAGFGIIVAIEHEVWDGFFVYNQPLSNMRFAEVGVIVAIEHLVLECVGLSPHQIITCLLVSLVYTFSASEIRVCTPFEICVCIPATQKKQAVLFIIYMAEYIKFNETIILRLQTQN